MIQQSIWSTHSGDSQAKFLRWCCFECDPEQLVAAMAIFKHFYTDDFDTDIVLDAGKLIEIAKLSDKLQALHCLQAASNALVHVCGQLNFQNLLDFYSWGQVLSENMLPLSQIFAKQLQQKFGEIALSSKPSLCSMNSYKFRLLE